MRSTPLVTVALAAMIAACQPAAPAGLTDADKAVLRGVGDTAQAILNSPPVDWEAYSARWHTEDVVVMPPGAAAISGRGAVVAFLKTFPPLSNVRFQVQETEGTGDLAYQWGTYEMDMAVPGMAAPVHDTGKFLEIWRRQADGSWKLTREMFNSDVPPPAPADTTKKS